jgi:hypothetical protein
MLAFKRRVDSEYLIPGKRAKTVARSGACFPMPPVSPLASPTPLMGVRAHLPPRERS